MARFEVAAFMVDKYWVWDGGRKGETWSRHVRPIQNVTGDGRLAAQIVTSR